MNLIYERDKPFEKQTLSSNECYTMKLLKLHNYHDRYHQAVKI